MKAFTVAASALSLLMTGGLCAAIERGVDAGIKPGDDFYAYANGAWLEATAIPPDKDRWGARDEIGKTTQARLVSLFKDAAQRPRSSYERKVGDFYTAYLNDALIESKGLGSVRPLLDRIDGVRDAPGISRILGEGLAVDVDPLNFAVFQSPNLFGLSIERGLNGEPKYLALLLQGGLGLPERGYYLDNTPQMQALRTRYRGYIGRLLELAGYDRAESRAAAVMEMETAIARTHGTQEESADNRNLDNRWTRAEFVDKAPGIEWGVFFAAAHLPKQESFVVWQPGAVKMEAALVASHPLDTWKDYLRFHVLDRFAEVLPRAFAEPALAMHDPAGSATPMQGRRAQLARAQLAMDATIRALPDAVGRVYVEKYFSAAEKARVRRIVDNVIEAFGRRVEALNWMEPATKTQAVLKLKTLYFGVGYPESWADYSQLRIGAGDAAGNLQRITEWNYRNALAKLHRSSAASDWVTAPQAVAAYSIPQQNAYNFAAGLLQAPKFDPAAPDPVNYGAIGAICGHEISHFVDLLGADYDARGAMHHWWTKQDRARFDTLSAALVEQFATYRPYPDLPVDGRLTLTENIADLGGLQAAFDAYRRTLGARAGDRRYVRQQDREFFLGFARAWRVKTRENFVRAQVRSNDHAPENFRVSTVRNLDAWYDAFDVAPGQRLYLDPKSRVRIW